MGGRTVGRSDRRIVGQTESRTDGQQEGRTDGQMRQAYARFGSASGCPTCVHRQPRVYVTGCEPWVPRRAGSFLSFCVWSHTNSSRHGVWPID